jgi:hypothetical protein
MIENIQRQVPSTAGGHKNSKGEGTILNTPRPPEVRAAPSRHRRRPWRQGSKPSVSDSDPKATSASTRGRSAPRAIPPRRRPETHPPGHHRHTRVLDSTRLHLSLVPLARTSTKPVTSPPSSRVHHTRSSKQHNTSTTRSSLPARDATHSTYITSRSSLALASAAHQKTCTHTLLSSFILARGGVELAS